MSLDRHAAERRRFACLLGTDDEYGTGLPVGCQEADETEAGAKTDLDDGDDDGDPVGRTGD
ncbi:hypothetical protein [Natrinema gelatinilyticum]|uniref:hypothetical protein n=1 Tax=Natrinema gelatinilyticum TaxID=2961571 RepID=UPI0020C502C2|nr:hypothetical protein [Natrinema gelatinilyticum]